jgi:hypothetical protein
VQAGRDGCRVLLSLLVLLAACGGTQHAVKLPPKPCRITSTQAECLAYLARRFKPGTVYVINPREKFSPMRWPIRKYPALCNKP